MMAELPPHPEVLCFSEYIQDFLNKDFQVDEFIGKCRKSVTIECLRQDLDSYYRTLKNAMIELINKDYADFVNLSANLVGMDKSIADLMTPLSQLQEEIKSIKGSMEVAIKAIDSKLAERKQIRKDKETLQRVVSCLESIEKLERLLKVKKTSGDSQNISEIEELSSKPEFAPMVMERVASEFNKLQYNSKLADHPLVDENMSRIHVVTSTLQSKLEVSFQSGLANGDRRVLTQCLQTYASINRCQAAEELFQIQFVHPYMDQLISGKALLTHAGGLAGLYADILHFIPERCSLLLELTHHIPSGGSAAAVVGDVIVKGFDFLVNSVWPEIVSILEKKASVIFAPGNPDAFHKNYVCSMEFISSFEKFCSSPASVKTLHNHPSYSAFLNKWSLPVYFQIRFQDIADRLESSLTLPLAPARTSTPSSDNQYKLDVFVVLEQCIEQCWSDTIFIPALVHRFWKLTLQGMEKTASSYVKTISVPECFSVIHDIELLHAKIVGLFRNHIAKKLPQKDAKQFEDCLHETSGQLQQLVPDFVCLIVSGLSHLCMQSLESANTLPRLYRRTNKEIPSKFSSYVSGTLRPLEQRIGDFPSHYRANWTDQVISAITKRYFEIVRELLTSVQRTEESLLKLKSYRKSLIPASTGGMTDDNKIRLQLALDIEQFTIQALALHPSAMAISEFKRLHDMGQTAKTTALATPPS